MSSSVPPPLTSEERRSIQWAVAFIREHPEPPACRCAGKCGRCREWKVQADRAGLDTVVRLLEYIEWLEESAC